MLRFSRRLALVAPFACAAVLSASSAFALQPVETFVGAAKTANPDMRIATAVATQRDAEADRAFGALLPSIFAKGIYTQNEYNALFPKKFLNANATTADVFGKDASTATIALVPYSQLDGIVGVAAPIIDVAGWERHSAARSAADAAAADEELTQNDVAKQVTRTYYQLVAEEAVLRSATRNLQIAQQNVATSKNKRQGGTASVLDIQRGTASVALAQQDVSASTLAVATTRRSLESLTGVAPEPSTSLAADDLHEEAALETWMGNSDKAALVVSARATQRAAESSADAASAEYIPRVTASATEHATNAPGFAQNTTFYTVQVVASWQLDLTIPANVRAQNAAATAATARADKAKRQADDQIFADWHQVRALIDRARATRTQLAAATSAADLTRDRYGSGMQTELEVLQAQEDAFRADVARIQADADLAYARAALRLDSAAVASGGSTNSASSNSEKSE